MERKFTSNKFITFNHKKILFYSSVFALFLLLDRFCSLTTDDFRYLAIGGMSGGVEGVDIPVKTLKDIITSQIYDYTHINGRFIVHCLTTFFCCFVDLSTFRIINSIAFVILIWNIDKILEYANYHSSANKYIIAFCLFFAFPVPREILIGHIATCINYLWVACATTAFIILLYNTYNKTLGITSDIVLFTAACIIGSLQESFSLGLSASLFIYSCLNFKAFKLSNKFLIFGYWIGTCILTFAPGNFARLANSEGSGAFNWFSRIIINAAYLLTASNMLLITITSMTILFIIRNDIFRKVWKKNLLYILSIIFSSFIVIIVFTGERQLMAIELFSLLIAMSMLHEIGLFNRIIQVKIILCSMLVCTAISYPFIYKSREKLHTAYSALQRSEVVDGIMYQNDLTKCSNELYRNPFIRKFIFPEGIDLYGLSLLKSKGSNSQFVKSVLPHSKEELVQQFECHNDNGIYHNKEEEYCLIKTDLRTEQIHIVSCSKASWLGKMRNSFFNRKNINVKNIVLTKKDSHFCWNNTRYYIIYDPHMEVYSYTFADNQ